MRLNGKRKLGGFRLFARIYRVVCAAAVVVADPVRKGNIVGYYIMNEQIQLLQGA